MTRGSYEGWHDAEIKTLRALWSAGYSGSLIADRLGRSRSAVLGKVHRLGIQRRAEVKRSRRAMALSYATKPERNQALFADYLGGMTRAEVAKRYGLTIDGVGTLLWRHKVKLPDALLRQRLSAAGRKAGGSPGRPPVWPDCPPQVRPDYDLLRRHGFRSADARQMLEAA